MRRRCAEGWTRSRGGHRGNLCKLAGFLFARFVLLYGIRDNAGTNLLKDHKCTELMLQKHWETEH